jgi:hypothetical protein
MLTLYVSAIILNGKYRLKWDPEYTGKFDAWIEKVCPSVHSIIAREFDTLPDLAELTDAFSKYNLDINNLTTRQFDDLKQALETLKEDEHADKETAKKNTAQMKIRDSVAFISACKALVAKLSSQNPEKVMETLATVEVPVIDNTGIPDPEQLYHELSTGVLTIEEAQLKIKAWYSSLHAKRVMTFLHDIRLFKLPEATEFKEPMDYEEKWLPFASLYEDIAEFLKGEDTVLYDGDPNIVPSDVFEELTTEFAPPVGAEDTDENDAVGTLPPPDVLPNIEEEGARELALAVYPLVKRIVGVSGLPGSIEQTMEQVSQHIHRKSRLQQVKEAMGSDTEAPDEALERLVAEERYSAAIKNEWERAKRHCILLFLAEWWIQLMQAIITGSLVFDPAVQASMEYVHLWSPTDSLKYIAAIVEDIIPWENFTSDFMTLVMEQHGAVYADILEGLKTVRPETDNAEKAKVSLIETIKAFKANRSTNLLPAFIAAYMYLPSLIPQKGINRRQVAWLQGCCLADVTHGYEVDGDWKKSQAALYSMKIQIGKERWLKPRRKLRVMSPVPVSTAKETKAMEKKTQRPTDKQNLLDADDEEVIPVVNGTWLTNEVASLLRKDASTVLNAAKDMINKHFSTEQAKYLNTAVFSSDLSFEQVIMVMMYIMTALNANKQIKEKDEILVTLKQMKVYMNQHACMYDVSVSMHSVLYVLALALCEGVARNNTMKTLYYGTVSKWVNTNAIMTPEKVADFINKKREEQKMLSLVKLDNMDDDDRVNMTEMKKLNLIKLVTRDELNAVAEDDPLGGEDYDDEGVREFYPAGADEDRED